MKVRDMKKIIKSAKFDDCECNFKLKSKGPQAPEWFVSFANEVRERFDKIESRLDKHEAMFKEHDWMK